MNRRGTGDACFQPSLQNGSTMTGHRASHETRCRSCCRVPCRIVLVDRCLPVTGSGRKQYELEEVFMGLVEDESDG